MVHYIYIHYLVSLAFSCALGRDSRNASIEKLMILKINTNKISPVFGGCILP